MFRYQTKIKKKPGKSRVHAWRPETVMLLKQLGVGVLSIVCVTGFVYGIWYVTRIPALTISTIEVVGGYTIAPEEVRQVALKSLSGEYVKLIPKSFSLLYPEAGILSAVTSIDKIKNPQLERINLTTLRLVIDEYVPFALWCNEREDGHCYYIDDEGRAFSVAPPLSGSAFLRYRTIGREPAQFDTLTDSAQLSAVAAVVAALDERFNFPVISVELDVVGDVFYILAGGSEIKVSKRVAVDETIRNLEAVLSADEFKALAPGDFPYIDLRFGNKVFVSDEWPRVETVSEVTTEGVSTSSLDVIPVVSADPEVRILPDTDEERARPEPVVAAEATDLQDDDVPLEESI